MKKILLSCLVLSILFSCGNSKDDKKDNSETDITKNPDYEKGLALIAKSNCLQCHKIDETLTGPPYREVAKRYANRPDTIIPYLAEKIINGGNGQWGEIWMTPNKGVSQEVAEAMVKYILLLHK